MLQTANIALEMETPWDLHFLIIPLVRSSPKDVVGTTVWRTGSLFLGNDCPPYDQSDWGNGDVYTTTYHLVVQVILKIDNACSATEAVLLRAPILLYTFWKRRGLWRVSASRIIITI